MGLCLGKHESSPNLNANKQQQQNQQRAMQTVSTRQVKATNVQQMSEQDKIILDLKKVQDSLNKRVQQMEKNADDAQQKAKDFLKSNNKIRAKYALQTKQLYDKQVESILNQDQVITKTIRQVQEKYDQLAVSNTLQAANKLMQDINKAIDMDGIEEAMGNLQELEMNNAKFDELYTQYVGQDKDQINDQLDQMEADIFKSDLKKHELNTEKPKIQNTGFQQQQQQQQQQQYQQVQQPQHQQQQQQQQQHNKDDIDDQLAMLA